MGKVFKILTVLVSFILISGAVGVAMLAFPIFGNQALIVRSGSMEPKIGVGSVVIVRESPSKQYKIGEIISFKYDSSTIITHRVTSVLDSPSGILYKTKGDANEEEDNWVVKQKDVIGKNYFTIPEFGKLLAFARSKYGFPLLIIFPAGLVILVEILNIIREVRKSRKRKELIHPLNFSDIHSLKYTTAFTKKNFGLVKAFIPIFLCGLFIQSTSAYFSDTETSSNNFFQAAASFGTPTPSPTPTNTPTPTPTPKPCTPCCGNNNNVTVSGGGTGSSTTVIVDNECNSTVNQGNSTTVNTNVNQSSSTGGNSSNNSSTTTTGNSTNSTTVTTTTSGNTSN